MCNPTELDDAELAELRISVQTEVERRANMAAIPGQLQALAAQYVEGGGDLADLTLEPPPAPEPPLIVDAPPDLVDRPTADELPESLPADVDAGTSPA